jgi:hypothetical protein
MGFRSTEVCHADWIRKRKTKNVSELHVSTYMGGKVYLVVPSPFLYFVFYLYVLVFFLG